MPADDFEGESHTNRLIMLAWLALVGFPLYYWFWWHVFPQPYENLPLRLIGMAVSAPFLFARRLQHVRWFNAYFYIVLTYALPFFFTFMFLMNEGSSVWSQSLLIAVFVLFNFEARVASLSFVVGTVAAYFAYVFVTHRHDIPGQAILVNVPIIAFAIFAAPIVKVSRRILAEEKLHGMASALGIISHELRTPLRSVDASARGLKRYLPGLVAFYERNHQVPNPDLLPVGRSGMMEAALDRIQTDVRYMNSAIDLLLTNVWQAKNGTLATQMFQINDLINKAIARYPFENEAQQARVSLDLRSDFAVDGNEDLGIMILFNLLKNALRATARAGKGEIRITTESTEKVHRLIFLDTGCGIPAQELPRIFRCFYSYPLNAGTGIGLAFCRETLGRWGAKISCRSEEHVYTEFVIQFRNTGTRAATIQ